MRPSGYSTFSYDITAFVLPGENVLAVRVEHSDLADSRWFTGSGIYRDVTLSILPRAHFLQDEVFVSTVCASDDEAELAVAWRLSESTGVTFTLMDAQGIAAATVADAGEQGVATLRVAKPTLWSPDCPNLYTLVCHAEGDEHEPDVMAISCGIRTFAFTPDTGFTLNNKPMKLKGVCLHHDAGALGAAVPKAVWARRLQKLKDVGCNAIRTSHNPPDTHLLDLCDEMGGQDIVQVEVCLLDRDRNPIVSRDEILHFALAGLGEIIGIENGATDDLTPYTSMKRATFMGHAIVYLRSLKTKAPITLYVTASNGVTESLRFAKD